MDVVEDVVFDGTSPVGTPTGTPVQHGPEFTCTATSKEKPKTVTIQGVKSSINKYSWHVTTMKSTMVFDEEEVQAAVQAFFANVSLLEGSWFIPIKMNGTPVLKINVPDNVNRVGLASPQNVNEFICLLKNPPLQLVEGCAVP
tara:strand:- start:588 stop:1016 length:429 start_codon:yes stop_codon:yes gene_type:complete